MKKRILFVDDEPRILEGLQNLLRRQRRRWDMVFAVGGQAGMDRLDAERFDVVVSDMRMPGVDGAMLLGHVQEHHPDVVRIVLSGHAGQRAALRALPVAHQFLTKPCDPDVLENIVERACNLQALIGDERVRRVVGKIDKLPSMPQVYASLTRALADDNTCAGDIARILEQDMAMCAKILQLVNSSFFRLRNRITRIGHAVAYLGFNVIKNLVLSVEVFQSGHDPSTLGGLSVDELQSHALAAAALATRLVEDKRHAEDAFMAGMLHDIGKLILAKAIPAQFRAIVAASRQLGVPLHVVEHDTTGVTHAEVGAYLLGIWGLPYTVVEAVANHHVPTRVPRPGVDALAGVHIANALIHEVCAARTGTLDLGCEPLEPSYLTALGVADRVDGWRRMAVEMSGDADG